MKRSWFPLCVTVAVLVFFYLPILMLFITSFNETKFSGVWSGPSLKWYKALLNNPPLWEAVRNSLWIGTSASILATLLGTSAAFALYQYKTWLQKIHYGLIYTPLIIPDILMGMSLLVFFIAIYFPLGLTTIFIAHTTFCISYVTFVVFARLQSFDVSLVEAAQDLGANRWQLWWKIRIPFLLPAIISGALLSFTLSIDDFVITFFVAGPGATTLPLYVYGMMKFGSAPLINALSVILLLFTFAIILCAQWLTSSREKK